jgi:hypothetical protein
MFKTILGSAQVNLGGNTKINGTAPPVVGGKIAPHASPPFTDASVINKLLSSKYPISILYLTKWLITTILTHFFLKI